jgi:hypothetical protein
MMNAVIRTYSEGDGGWAVCPDPWPRPSLLALAALGAVLAFAGCKAAVSLNGSFATPREIVSGNVQATTNAVTVGGSYQTGGTNVTGAITVAK